MKATRETFGSTNAGEKNKGLTEVAATARDSEFQTGNTATAVKYCHGSVCLGSQKPTNCICPTDKK